MAAQGKFPKSLNELEGDESTFNMGANYLFIVARNIEKISLSAQRAMYNYAEFPYAKLWSIQLSDLYNIVECQLKSDDVGTVKLKEVRDLVDTFERINHQPESKGMLVKKYQEVIIALEELQRDLYHKMQKKKLIMPAEKLSGKAMAANRWIDRPTKKW